MLNRQHKGEIGLGKNFSFTGGKKEGCFTTLVLRCLSGPRNSCPVSKRPFGRYLN